MDGPELRAVLAENIRAAAEVKGFTVTRLADFAAVARSQLFAVLAGAASPSVDWICKVASALDVEPYQLLMRRAGAKGGRPRRRGARSP